MHACIYLGLPSGFYVSLFFVTNNKYKGPNAFVQNTELSVVEDSLTVITAQGRQTDDDTGFSFVHCSIIGSAKGTFLGRAWMPKPRVIYSYTTMGSGVNPLGWSDNFHPDRDK